MPLDQPALVGAHVGKLVRWEAAQLEDLAGKRRRPAADAVGEHDLDALPPVPGNDLEHRPDFHDEAGLLADLARERVLDPLARMQEASEEPPLRRAETVPREENLARLVDTEPGDADKEAIVRGGHEAPLPANGERVEHHGQEAHEHRDAKPSPGLRSGYPNRRDAVRL